MRVNYDIIRDVLLYLEENLNFEENSVCIKPIYWSEIYNNDRLVQRYSIADIQYAIIYMKEKGLIECAVAIGKNNKWIACKVTKITVMGHDYLETVRGDKTWQCIKEKCLKFGGITISAVLDAGKEMLKMKLLEH